MLSIADVQWVLHQAADADELTAEIRRDGKAMALSLKLTDGWRRRTSISWRITTAELRRKFLDGIEYRDLSPEDRNARGLAAEVLALKAARGVSRYTGAIRRGDVVIAVDGDHTHMSEGDLIAYFVQAKQQGDEVTFSILRGEDQVQVNVPVR